MKTLTRILVLIAGLGLLASCSEMVKKTIQDNPEIVFEAIKKDPAGFMKVVRGAAQEAQKVEMQAAQQAEDKAREDEFNNPKKPEVASNRAILGASNAQVTIVEYSDFQCPFCQRGSNTVARVLEEYPGKVKLLFKHLPLEQKHPNARRGSEYFEAIALQDAKKAYEFKKLVFQNQNETYGDAEKLYKKLAGKVGADMGKLQSDLKGKAKMISDIIGADMKEASKFGFNGTPGYLINGVSLKGAYPFEEFKKVIDRHLGKK
ncbi:MAG: DsbA family protein [Pseudomonadota bacterium]